MEKLIYHNDALGHPINIGDIVMAVRKNYRDMTKAKVIKFTPQFIVVEYGRSTYPEEYRIDPGCVVNKTFIDRLKENLADATKPTGSNLLS